jgi:hypothetical protein
VSLGHRIVLLDRSWYSAAATDHRRRRSDSDDSITPRVLHTSIEFMLHFSSFVIVARSSLHLSVLQASVAALRTQTTHVVDRLQHDHIMYIRSGSHDATSRDCVLRRFNDVWVHSPVTVATHARRRPEVGRSRRTDLRFHLWSLRNGRDVLMTSLFACIYIATSGRV